MIVFEVGFVDVEEVKRGILVQAKVQATINVLRSAYLSSAAMSNETRRAKAKPHCSKCFPSASMGRIREATLVLKLFR